MIVASIEALIPFTYVSCINYLVSFWKDSAGSVLALIDSGSKVNAMHLAYAKKPSLNIQKTDMRAQIIDRIILETFGMVIEVFSVYDRVKKVCFFEKTFLLADISIDVALEMPFLTLSNANVRFTNWKLY